MKPIVLQLVLALLVSTGCGTTPGQDVRYEPTPMPVVRALLELAEVGPQDLVFDLGSGDGRIPITAAKEFGARGVGIEIDPALVTQAQANAREAGVEDKVEFRLGDMYAADVRPATIVTLFLNPGPNLKLREKLRSDLQAGSRVVSYVWDMGGWKPTEIRRVNDHRIFLWRIRDRSSAQQITRSRDQPICIASPFMLCARYPMNPLARSSVACITIGAMSDPVQGFKLFDRLSRGVKISSAGKLFLEDTRGILQQLDEATEMRATCGARPIRNAARRIH